MDYIEIGKRLREARLEKRITQEKFAEMIGVSTGYISQVESGSKCFNLKRFNEAGQILEKPTSYFVDGTIRGNNNYLINEIVDLLADLPEDKIRVVREMVRAIVVGEK